MIARRIGLILLGGLALAAGPGRAPAAPPDDLLAGFSDPPASARPRVWWHWMNGNITEEGIRADLSWMHRVGIGGVQNFDANLGTPQVVAQRRAYMTPAWREAFRTAVEVARTQGLEFTIASSPGWSETGGPWVTPANGMKKLVWSEIVIPGGRHFVGRLPAPPMTTGPYATLPVKDRLSVGNAAAPAPSDYSEVAVLALPAGPAAAPAVPHAVTATGRVLNSALLARGDLGETVEVERGTPQAPGAIVLTYPRATTVRGATLFVPDAVPFFGDPAFLPALEVHDAGGWRRIAELPLGDVPTTVALAPVTGTEFRLVLAPNTGPKRVGFGVGAPGALTLGPPPMPPAATLPIAELRLHQTPVIHRFEAKAGFSLVDDYYALGLEVPGEAAGIPVAAVVNLTGRLRPDGTLDWTPPPGRWRILRLGCSLTGKTNHPASAEATGLEVDKYDGAAVKDYLQAYFQRYREVLGGGRLGDRGLSALLNDSIEVGPSNWTPHLLERFAALRGYDARPWLPALTGIVIGSRRQSDAFLYDFRRTLADLLVSEHYGTVTSAAHAEGLVTYGEALEDGRPVLGDDMAMRGQADIPMSALWSYARGEEPRSTFLGDMKGASSVAHLRGGTLVAAESFTSAFSPWAFAPADLLRYVNLEFDFGITRPVIHTSVHQPLDDHQPGLSLAIFGQYFNRHETWAEMARPWIDYIARSSFLLQQGRNVADVAYFYGEEAPLTALFYRAPLSDTPTAHAYDFVDAETLLHQLSVREGALVTPGGASYRALYLGGTSGHMTLPMLRRVRALAEAGATVIGERPSGSPSLADDPVEFARLADGLWSGAALTPVGRGRVLVGRSIDATLDALGERPDFQYAKPQRDSDVRFVHRRTGEADIYFVDNRSDRPQRFDAHFRVTGRRPQLWRADTGRAEDVSYRGGPGETVVALELNAEEALFVVFRESARQSEMTVPATVETDVAELTGPWNVTFQTGRGAPPSARFDGLRSLSDSSDPGIRYFSGIAAYSTRFALPRSWRRGGRLVLDLGRVADVAEVRINGEVAGIAWKPPYRVAIGEWLRPGENQVEIRVANLWVNRLIGDAQPGAVKIAYTALPTYQADAPLRPSGLLGPVRVID